MVMQSDHRARLEALRDQLAAAIGACSENMLPQLAGQYRATLEDIAKLDDAEPKAGLEDDLKAQRAERRKRQRLAK